jgi:hypothetical protein
MLINTYFYCSPTLQLITNDSPLYSLTRSLSTVTYYWGMLWMCVAEQIKLPNGTAVQGGFMASDCLDDVTAFARHFFIEDRYVHTHVTSNEHID